MDWDWLRTAAAGVQGANDSMTDDNVEEARPRTVGRLVFDDDYTRLPGLLQARFSAVGRELVASVSTSRGMRERVTVTAVIRLR